MEPKNTINNKMINYIRVRPLSCSTHGQEQSREKLTTSRAQKG